jgi:hypothetical protein
LVQSQPKTRRRVQFQIGQRLYSKFRYHV